MTSVKEKYCINILEYSGIFHTCCSRIQPTVIVNTCMHPFKNVFYECYRLAESREFLLYKVCSVKVVRRKPDQPN